MVGIPDVRHQRVNPNIKVWDKEVKTQLVYYLLIVLLIKQHVSAYSEAIIRFNKCQL